MIGGGDVAVEDAVCPVPYVQQGIPDTQAGRTPGSKSLQNQLFSKENVEILSGICRLQAIEGTVQ